MTDEELAEYLSISIHAPRGGSDDSRTAGRTLGDDFNPRSPWGERLQPRKRLCRSPHFNPRSPWGERPLIGFHLTFALSFQSTLPVGGATAERQAAIAASLISIHAPRGGSDWQTYGIGFQYNGFQSTLPVGGATRFPANSTRYRAFQSTLPVGGATVESSILPAL